MTAPDPLIARVVAAMKAVDRDRGADAEGALEWLTAGEGPAVITQARLQEFLWYYLPTRWMMGTGEHRAVADALAEALELLGLPRYAAICRSATTAAVLDAYEQSISRGKAAFRKAFRASGIEPPDLPDFVWGPVMGPHEAHAHDAVAGLLEMAVAAGDLVPGRRGRQKEREELVRTHLSLARVELGGASFLDMIRAERLEHWLSRHNRGRVWPHLLPELAPLLGRPHPPPADAADDPLPPLRWLLGRLLEGQALTQTDNLNRAFVQEASTHFGWSDATFFGPPHCEDELVPLRLTHDLAQRMKALRRRGKAIYLSPKGRALLADPGAMWCAAAAQLLPRHGFGAAVGEVALALPAVVGPMTGTDICARVQEAVADLGWHDRDTGAPPDERAVRSGLTAPFNLLDALNLLTGRRRARLGAELTPTGRAFSLQALHTRATGPLPPLPR